MELDLPLELIRVMIEEARRIVLKNLNLEYGVNVNLDQEMLDEFFKVKNYNVSDLPKISNLDNVTDMENKLLAINIYENVKRLENEEI